MSQGNKKLEKAFKVLVKALKNIPQEQRTLMLDKALQEIGGQHIPNDFLQDILLGGALGPYRFKITAESIKDLIKHRAEKFVYRTVNSIADMVVPYVHSVNKRQKTSSFVGVLVPAKKGDVIKDCASVLEFFAFNAYCSPQNNECKVFTKVGRKYFVFNFFHHDFHNPEMDFSIESKMPEGQNVYFLKIAKKEPA